MLEQVVVTMDFDTIRDMSINILDRLVDDGVVKDCTDTDEDEEWDVQDAIVDVLCKGFKIVNQNNL